MTIERHQIDLTVLKRIMAFAKLAAKEINKNLKPSGEVGSCANAKEFVLNNVSLLRQAYDSGLTLEEVKVIAGSFLPFFSESYFNDDTIAHGNFIEFKMGSCLFYLGYKKSLKGMKIDCFPNIDFSGVNLSCVELDGHFRFSKFPARESWIKSIYFEKQAASYPIYIGSKRGKAIDLQSDSGRQERFPCAAEVIKKDEAIIRYISILKGGVRHCFFSPDRKRRPDELANPPPKRFHIDLGREVTYGGDYALVSPKDDSSPRSFRPSTPRARRLERLGKYVIRRKRFYLFGDEKPAHTELAAKLPIKKHTRKRVLKSLPLLDRSAKVRNKEGITIDEICYEPRKSSQAQIMGIDPSGYAQVMELPAQENYIWEWSHMVAHCFNLADPNDAEEKENMDMINDDPSKRREYERKNLVLTTFECNRHMLIFESEMKNRVEKGGLKEFGIKVFVDLEPDKHVPEQYTHVAKNITYVINANGEEFEASFNPLAGSYPQGYGRDLVLALLDEGLFSEENWNNEVTL